MNPDNSSGPEATLERMLASHLVAPALTDAFDRSVLERLERQQLHGPERAVEQLAWAERERLRALARLSGRLRRGFGAALLDLAGFAALAWTVGQVAPRLAELADRFNPALPAIVAALALAAGYLIVREQRLV
ncbi:MAG: hypothetical protein EPO25_09335 [Gammaproteobacteria bacterium]|nr:MAG: hypothetical protein EPO25_09335 [Gammaproteobacteria bacterium]